MSDIKIITNASGAGFSAYLNPLYLVAAVKTPWIASSSVYLVGSK